MLICDSHVPSGGLVREGKLLMDFHSFPLRIKEIIANDLDMNITVEEIDDNASLYDDGLGLDSIAIINFIVLLEKRFDISFDDSEISARVFHNIRTLTDFIAAKLKARPEKAEI